MKTLFAGPYTGEFGWELACWNPRLRRHVERGGYDRVIVCGPRSSSYLYEFADEYVEVEVLPGTSDFMQGTLATPAPPMPDGELEVLQPPWEWCAEELKNFRRPFQGPEVDKSWRDLSRVDLGVRSADVCLAFRPPKLFNGKLHEDKAWPIDRCKELDHQLRAVGVDVAYIGGSDNYCFGSAGEDMGEDMRGTPLEAQCAVISSACITVGPSSAPLHLSQLCSTGVVTWYARPRVESEGRYESWWNPFGAPQRFVGTHQPSVSEVYAAVMELLG